MSYKISRAFTGRLTKNQKGSPVFSEEPRVLGKVLRRGSRPMILSDSLFAQNEAQLRRLEKWGSITISHTAEAVVEEAVVDPTEEPIVETEKEQEEPDDSL